MGRKGIITRIIGPVVDVNFGADVPEINNALTVETKSGVLILEVHQQLDGGEVRCIAMHSTDGLSRGMSALDTGAPLSVPVGEAMLGPELLPQGELDLRIQRAHRLVKQDHIRIQHERPGNRHTLLLPAGELFRFFPDVFLQSDSLNDLPDLPVRFVLPEFPALEGVGNIMPHVHIRKQ